MLGETERTLLFFSLSKITVPRAKWVRITRNYKELGGKCWQDCGVNTKMFWRLPHHELKLLEKHWRPFDLTPFKHLPFCLRLAAFCPRQRTHVRQEIIAKKNMLSNIHSLRWERDYFHSAHPTGWAEESGNGVCMSVITSKMINMTARRLHRPL